MKTIDMMASTALAVTAVLATSMLVWSAWSGGVHWATAASTAAVAAAMLWDILK